MWEGDERPKLKLSCITVSFLVSHLPQDLASLYKCWIYVYQLYVHTQMMHLSWFTFSDSSLEMGRDKRRRSRSDSDSPVRKREKSSERKSERKRSRERRKKDRKDRSKDRRKSRSKDRYVLNCVNSDSCCSLQFERRNWMNIFMYYSMVNKHLLFGDVSPNRIVGGGVFLGGIQIS